MNPPDPKEREAALHTLAEAFLRWPLPESVCADLCATMHGRKDRVGTNLLTYTEAKQMFCDIVEPQLSAARDEIETLKKRLLDTAPDKDDFDAWREWFVSIGQPSGERTAMAWDACTRHKNKEITALREENERLKAGGERADPSLGFLQAAIQKQMADLRDRLKTAVGALEHVKPIVQIYGGSYSTGILDASLAQLRADRSPSGAQERTAEADITEAIKTAWKAGVTCAANVAIERSNRINADDGDLGIVHALSDAGRAIAKWSECTDYTLNEIRQMLPAQPSGREEAEAVRDYRIPARGEQCWLELNNAMGDCVRVEVVRVFKGGTVRLRELGTGKIHTNNVVNLTYELPAAQPNDTQRKEQS